jgi:hypothetical protein
VLDPAELAAYEAWKLAKLSGSVDLSVSAYNREVDTAALAWEEGWRAHANGDEFDSCRFRKPFGTSPSTYSRLEEEAE